MTDFDHDLYGRVMATFSPGVADADLTYSDGFRDGVFVAAKFSARISAERQPVPVSDDLYEKLAAIEHERWADWQRYMHNLCNMNGDGSLTSPSSFVTHWERQIATPYADLSERDKQSDRDQVDRYWPLLTTLNAAAKESDSE
jgi:hypothetical protein